MGHSETRLARPNLIVNTKPLKSCIPQPHTTVKRSRTAAEAIIRLT